MATALPLFGGEDRLTVKADGADLAAGQLVHITGFSYAGGLTAVAATATGEADGVMNVDAADGEVGACVMLVPGTVIKVKSAAGLAADALVIPGAAGVVTATGATAGDAIGRTLTATDADGNVLVLVK